MFLIRYTMAQVVRAKDRKYGLETQNVILNDGDEVNFITRDDAVSDDTLALGDIAYYAFIGDVIRAYKADTASVKLDTVNRKDKKAATVDGTEYTQSDVHSNRVVSNEYGCEVALMNGIEYAARVYNDGIDRQDVVDTTRRSARAVQEEVGLIHENGIKEENVRIDVRASKVRDYRVALGASGGWAQSWGSGLYYMYPTNTKGLCTVEPMYPEDIAENNYVVG